MKKKLLFVLPVLVFVASCKKDVNNEVTTVAGDESTQYNVSTLNPSFDPGEGSIDSPGDIVFDSQGNLYVADFNGDKVRKITPAGVMSTYAGSTIGNSDGPALAAQFRGPNFLTIDGQGNIYVGELGGNKIRKINTSGQVTTVAGNGDPGLVDGNGTAAKLGTLGGLIIDSRGNLFFTQTGFNGIRKVSANGDVTQFAGSVQSGYADGSGSAARFNQPYSLVVDQSDNIYVSDNGNAALRKITPQGEVSTVIKRSSPSEMYKIARDTQGNFYIGQGENNHMEIAKLTVAGKITKIAGGEVGHQDGPGNTALLGIMSGMTVGPNGAIYVSECFTHLIRKIVKN